MFTTLGSFVYRRRRLVVAVWVVVLALGMALGGQVADRLSTEFTGNPELESARVVQRLEELAGTGGEVVAVISGAATGEPAVRAEVEAASTDIATMAGVVSVVDHYTTGDPSLVSADGQATLLVATVDGKLSEEATTQLGESISERLREIDGPTVGLAGALPLNQEFIEGTEEDLVRGESIALPIAFVAMVVVFGGVLAAGLPLVLALASVAGAMIVLFGASALTDVSVFALNVTTILGLGLGIDYGLLLVSRFPEERAAGLDVAAAVGRAVATAGTTIAFSGLTVAVALAGLFLLEDPTFTSFGLAGTGVVVVSMAAGVTLLPALLGMVGGRIKPARARPDHHGYFWRLSHLVQRRAVPVVSVVAVGLAVLAVPFLGARFEVPDARSLPQDSEVRATAEVLAERFPAMGADPITVVADVAAATPELSAYVERLEALRGVAAVSTRPGLPPGVSVIDVVPAGTSQDEAAQALVEQIRDLQPGFAVDVGGTAAFLVDFEARLGDRLPLVLGVIAAATFVLLFLMTGSVAVPVKAILMNLLSLGATFGALVWIFQDGNLSGLLGFESVGSLDLFTPVLIFIFAFGLSMDYEVFMLSRIKEAHDETGDNDGSVAMGLQRSGRIITSAALLIVVVFAGFAAGDTLIIKQFGVGMALAVVVDATIVRSLLVPATMKLLGEWNWWAPAPMRRLHQRVGLHEPAPAPPPDPATPAEGVSPVVTGREGSAHLGTAHEGQEVGVR